MRQGKQIHQGYSFFWGVFLLLVMSAAISIHAEENYKRNTNQNKKKKRP